MVCIFALLEFLPNPLLLVNYTHYQPLKDNKAKVIVL